jgi:hypothetical protein
MRDRHLARAEAAQLNTAFEFVEALGQAGFQIGRWHLNLEFALETVGNCFCDFHNGNLHIVAARGVVGLVL